MSITTECPFCQHMYKTMFDIRDCPECEEPADRTNYLPLRWLEKRPGFTQQEGSKIKAFICSCGVWRRSKEEPCEHCGATTLAIEQQGPPAWVLLCLEWPCGECRRVVSRLDWRIPTLQELAREVRDSACAGCLMVVTAYNTYEQLLSLAHSFIDLSFGEEGRSHLTALSIAAENPLKSYGARSALFSFDENFDSSDPFIRKYKSFPNPFSVRIFPGMAPCPRCLEPVASSVCGACGFSFSRAPRQIEEAWERHIKDGEIYLHEERQREQPQAQLAGAPYREQVTANKREHWYWVLFKSREPSRLRLQLEARAFYTQKKLNENKSAFQRLQRFFLGLFNRS